MRVWLPTLTTLFMSVSSFAQDLRTPVSPMMPDFPNRGAGISNNPSMGEELPAPPRSQSSLRHQ